MRRIFKPFEIIVIILLVGIFVAIATFASLYLYNSIKVHQASEKISKYASLTKEDLKDEATIAATKGALAALRVAIAVEHAKNLVNNVKIKYPYPDKIIPSIFSDREIPCNRLSNSNRITYASSEPTTQGEGWRYDRTSGRVWVNDVRYKDW